MTDFFALDRKRLVLLGLIVALAMALTASTATAANVANPNPGVIAQWEPCEPHTGVTVIVDDRPLGEGKIYVRCALGEQPSGLAALQQAGFAIEGTTSFGLAFICRIDGEPTFAQQSCETTPGAGAYWSYWHGQPGGRWSYSTLGASNPATRAPINSVQGWSFGGGEGPRIEPMNGSGPSSFALPAAQESSVVAAKLASPWLVSTLDATAAEGEALEAENDSLHGGLELALRGAVVLSQAGVAPAALSPVATWLSRSGEEKHATVEGFPLRQYLRLGESREVQSTAHLALAVLALQALGQDLSDFAGLNLREQLEGTIQKTGLVKSQGEASEAAEVTAPTVLALARTGTLSAKALKTLELMIAEQSPSGTFEGVTSIDVEAIQALAAAREQGAVLGAERLQAVESALSKAGEYLQSIQEPDGGVRSGERDEPVFDPTVVSTALGATGLALSGRQTSAELAARWVSRYQVTAEYAGEGNREIGEETPAEDLIGAFLPNEAALRTALAFGLQKEGPVGVFSEAQLPTIDALSALLTAGPYGPYDVQLSAPAPFEARTLGLRSLPRSATLTNEDVRPVTITGAHLGGEQAGDFAVEVDGCTGRTLAPRESCDVSANFDPTALGLREAQLVLTLQGSSRPIEQPLSGTGEAAPGPEPGPGEDERESSAGEHKAGIEEPHSSLGASQTLATTTSHAAAKALVASIGARRLTLRLARAGSVNVGIERSVRRGRRRVWRRVKTIKAKAVAAGLLAIALPRLSAGSYRASIDFAGSKSLTKTFVIRRAH
jgi:hypothetical protein